MAQGWCANGCPPVGVDQGQIDLCENYVDDAIEDLVLVGDMVVDGHRLDAEFLGERPHGQCRIAFRISDGDSTV
jgi:hypothetical protein